MACALTRSNTTTLQPMPPALNGWMLSHTAKAVSFHHTLQRTGAAVTPAASGFRLAPTACGLGQSRRSLNLGSLGRNGRVGEQRLEPRQA
jgi:hypothetical protein